jgi:hypothetical protein
MVFGRVSIRGSDTKHANHLDYRRRLGTALVYLLCKIYVILIRGAKEMCISPGFRPPYRFSNWIEFYVDVLQDHWQCLKLYYALNMSYLREVCI